MANHKFVRVAAPLGDCLSALLNLLNLFIAQNLTKSCALALVLALTTLFKVVDANMRQSAMLKRQLTFTKKKEINCIATAPVLPTC